MQALPPQTQHPPTSTSQATSGSLSAYTPAQIEAAKAQWMQKYQLRTRPTGSGFQIDRWVAIALISGISLPITGIGIAYILSTGTPTAATERMLVSQMNMIEAQNQELRKPREICILAYCPPDKPSNTTNPTVPAIAPSQIALPGFDGPKEGEIRQFNTKEKGLVWAEFTGGQWVSIPEDMLAQYGLQEIE